jgi:hypothetical protein
MNLCHLWRRYLCHLWRRLGAKPVPPLAQVSPFFSFGSLFL